MIPDPQFAAWTLVTALSVTTGGASDPDAAAWVDAHRPGLEACWDAVWVGGADDVDVTVRWDRSGVSSSASPVAACVEDWAKAWAPSRRQQKKGVEAVLRFAAPPASSVADLGGLYPNTADLHASAGMSWLAQGVAGGELALPSAWDAATTWQMLGDVPLAATPEVVGLAVLNVLPTCAAWTGENTEWSRALAPASAAGCVDLCGVAADELLALDATGRTARLIAACGDTGPFADLPSLRSSMRMTDLARLRVSLGALVAGAPRGVDVAGAVRRVARAAAWRGLQERDVPVNVHGVAAMMEVFPHVSDGQALALPLTGIGTLWDERGTAPACRRAVDAARAESATASASDAANEAAMAEGLAGCVPGCWSTGTLDERLAACTAAGLPAPHDKAESWVWLTLAGAGETLAVQLDGLGETERATALREAVRGLLGRGW